MNKKFLRAGVHRARANDVGAAVAGFEQEGWKVFVLPDGISDHEGFFRAARALFPLDPPLASYDNWDALADSLSAGLYDLPDRRIAILWPDTTVRIPHPTTYEIALGVLEQVQASLADLRVRAGKPKDVAVVVGK